MKQQIINSEKLRLRFKILTPEKILSLSHGEVKVPKTIDASKELPVPGGLHCMRIFGPVKDYTCYCGLIKHNKKARGALCPECKVPIIESASRRERFGHITLATPVVHPLFYTHLATLLNIAPETFENIVNCRLFLLQEVNGKTLQKMAFIKHTEYFEMLNKGFIVKALTGGECVLKLLEELNLSKLYENLKKLPPSRRINARLKVVRDLLNSETNPQHFIITHLPVLPADLRPVLFLDDGTVASHDLNELYADVILKNNRLKKFIAYNAPTALLIISRIALQKSINSLLDGTGDNIRLDRKGKRAYKGFIALLSTKEGHLRHNLLGKRVDFSGRSAITAGPELKLHEVGIPRQMAFELFRPFMYHWLIQQGYASSIAHAKAIVDAQLPEAHEALEEVITEHPVLLNRAPTLHKLSIQAFYPVLTEGKAIKLHPLVCSGYNADFDGDQMAVHVPLSYESQIEASVLMLSPNNLRHPATGEPAMIPSQDMVLGLYWLTIAKETPQIKTFASTEEVLHALENGYLTEQTVIKIRLNGQFIETTPGRLIIMYVLPEEIDFNSIKFPLDKKSLKNLIKESIQKAGFQKTVILLDRLKELGFKYATLSGATISAFDIPKIDKEQVFKETDDAVSIINEQFKNGFIVEEERYNQTVNLWLNAQHQITNLLKEKIIRNPFNPISMMINSGARGSIDQLRQMSGLKGLMAKPTGEIVEIPIKSSLIEGLSAHEFFLSTHGARKGRADGALKTATAGYLTRRLVEAAQNLVITVDDCGTTDGIEISALKDGQNILIPLAERIIGRTSALTITDPVTNEVIVNSGEIITEKIAKAITTAGISSVIIRSPITCKQPVCARCYGLNLSDGYLPEPGLPVGIIAAQSIGEPGTQLTLRTFHSGGAASSKTENTEITSSDEGRVKLHMKTVSKSEDVWISITHGGYIKTISTSGERDIQVPYGAEIFVRDGQTINKGTLIARWNPGLQSIIATCSGTVRYQNITPQNFKEEYDPVTGITRKLITGASPVALLTIENNSTVKQLTCLQPGTILLKEDGEEVSPGEELAKMPPKTLTTQDITSGIKEVENIFEARNPKKSAILAGIEGEIDLLIHEKEVEIIITQDNSRWSVVTKDIPVVSKGDYVMKSQKLTPGEVNLKDILRIEGFHKTAVTLLNILQGLYAVQGVTINSKHFEVIIRKMLNFLQVTSPGRTDFIPGEIISRTTFEEKSPEGLIAEPVLVGISRAALLGESVLARASFIRTGHVLADAVTKGEVDELKNIKENIILGRLIPAGTGRYRDTLLKKEAINAKISCSFSGEENTHNSRISF
jgi:DNA-directed RNA polymerase subunit beta'